jgi:hypothetical protein
MTARVAAFIGYGVGGRFWSGGMDLLAQKLRALGCFCPPTYRWRDWSTQARAIRAESNDTKIVIAGHSLDANLVPRIAAAAGRSIDLLVGYDPTLWYPCPRIPKNVKAAICFHGVNWLNPLGHARYAVADPAATKLTIYNTSKLHHRIDDDNNLHRITVNTVRELMG